jgi:2-polyprenyl-6-methoxyphenol hydroxylase-like FAD-dependent oxidoreductase
MAQVLDFRPHYDAIIVGARCAGAATAMLLAKAGLRVLAVDRQPYGSDTLSTHALMRPAVVQLSRWGLLDELVKSGAPIVRSSTFHYGEEEIAVAIKEEPGISGLIAPRRTVLDRFLVDAARAAGATMLHDTHVHELTFDRHGRVVGVALTNPDGQPRYLACELVVGADGLSSLVARAARAKPIATGRAPVAHAYGYATIPAALSGYHWYFQKGLAGSVIPTNDGVACCVASLPTECYDRAFRTNLEASWRDALDAFSPGLGRHAADHRLGRLKAFRGAAGLLRQAYGRGWILVGDAGFFRDPLTSHGISDALRDAEGAAAAVIGGHRSHFRQFEEERNGIARRVLETTDAIGAFDWSLDRLPELHKEFSAVMKSESALLSARASSELPEAQPRYATQ